MKRGKRILALAGVVLILLMYGCTMFFAIFDNSETMSMFKASLVTTILVPILLWVYTFIFKLVSKKDDSNKDSE